MKNERARSEGIADGFPGERLVILPPAVVHRSSRLPVCRGLLVTHTGRFDRVHGHHVSRPRGTEDYVLMICLGGTGYGHFEGRRWSLQGGEGVILPPHKAHDYTASIESPWSLIWFHFRGEWAKDYVKLLGGTGQYRRFAVAQLDLIIEAFEECHTYVRSGFSDADLIGLTTAFSRLLGLCRTLARHSDPRFRNAEDRVLRTVRFMRENIRRPIALSELASTAALSVPHYCAIFKRAMNCSPIEFQTRLRLQKACELLAHDRTGVGEISFLVGFTDPLYFSRVFRKQMGVTASEYRRRSRSTTALSSLKQSDPRG